MKLRKYSGLTLLRGRLQPKYAATAFFTEVISYCTIQGAFAINDKRGVKYFAFFVKVMQHGFRGRAGLRTMRTRTHCYCRQSSQAHYSDSYVLPQDISEYQTLFLRGRLAHAAQDQRDLV